MDAAALGRHHLIGGNGDRTDLLLGARVLTDLLRGQRGALDQLITPLSGRDGVGDQDQRGRLRLGHGGRTDDGLACATGQDDHAGTAVEEGLGGLLLVGPQVPTRLIQLDRVGLTVDVAGQILGRPAELEQHLLEGTALGRVDHHGVVVDLGAEQTLDLGALHHLGQHGTIGADQHQSVAGLLLDPQPAVAIHRVGHVDQQRGRHRITAVAQQDVDHLLGVVTGRAGVPEAERSQPIGVDVLRRPLELGERRDGDPARVRVGMVDLEQQTPVGLDDERSGIHSRPKP